MLKIDTKVVFDRTAAIAKIKSANDRALTYMGMQALKDVTKHVPIDHSPLQNSGLTHSDRQAENGVFTLRWDVPYAQYLYHGKIMHGRPETRTINDYYGDINFTSALARAEWAKYAAEVYGDRWRTVYEAALRKEMQ